MFTYLYLKGNDDFSDIVTLVFFFNSNFEFGAKLLILKGNFCSLGRMFFWAYAVSSMVLEDTLCEKEQIQRPKLQKFSFKVKWFT